MDITEKIKHQRIKHIINSYQLTGNETKVFDRHLERLLSQYPFPLIELALVETLVNHWLNVPPLKGCHFLEKAHRQLKDWEECLRLQANAGASAIASTITPAQFHQITGLDPSLIFGQTGLPPSQPPSPLQRK